MTTKFWFRSSKSENNSWSRLDKSKAEYKSECVESFDSDLKKLKVLRVENDSNPIVAYLNINSLGEKINQLREIWKESPTDILCVDETNR